MSKIIIFENNSHTVTETVTGVDTLSGYTAVLTVRDAINSTGVTFQVTGTTEGLVNTYEITPAHVSGHTGTYDYDTTITDGTKNYTINQSKLVIKPSVRW